MCRIAFIFPLIFGLPLTLFAADWAAPSELWDSPLLLKTGQSSFAFSQSSRRLSARFDKDGNRSGLATKSRQREKTENGEIIRQFDIKVSAFRFMPTLAFGLTDQWTFLARMNFTKIEAEVNQNVEFVSTDTGRLVSRSLTSEESKRLASRSENAPPPGKDFSTMRMGMFEFQSRHALFRGVSNEILLVEYLRFPSAEQTKIDFYTQDSPVYQSPGLGLGLMSSHAWKIAKLSLKADYNYQYEDEVYARRRDGFATEEQIARQPGDEFTLATNVHWNWTNKFSFLTGVEQTYFMADEYENINEDLLETEDAEKTSGLLGVRYLAKRLSGHIDSYSLAANASYSPTIVGKNIEDSDLWSLELTLIY